ncbi:MAG: thioredoxin domain-containing protein [Woeseiaceae bacterium]
MNKLSDQSSLYLRQHADNPVEWWPWGQEALDAAKAQNKPILLSIGYAACHWCHVMAHESFEDPKIAALMNQAFINIKVDREQRPDLDKIYQTAHQLIVQRPGGWPLTMFLTPDEQLPFFGGTYFPPTPRQGMPGFTEVISKVAEFHAANPDEAARQGGAVRDVFDKMEPAASNAAVDVDAVTQTLRKTLGDHADQTHGGFGRSPKFPQVPSLLWLLHHWRSTAKATSPDVEALFLSALAQTRMAEGGLMDQVGGGFFRYCVDERWQTPHFEKMLYDNAQLLQVYAETWQATGETLFRDTASMTADWLLNTMQHEQGGFFSAIDADTEAGEGGFYTWSVDELRGALNDDDFAFCFDRYGLDGTPNFEGRWHLTVSKPISEIAEQHGTSTDQIHERILRINGTLQTARQQRAAPAVDRKVLTSHNALVIKALSIAARSVGRQDWQDAAHQCARFLLAQAYDDGVLTASWHDGHAEFNAYLDDYVFLADACLELLQSEWHDDWLNLAMRLVDTLLDSFEDPESGGFFFTATSHEQLMYRQKPIADEAMPAGNAIALRVLLRLGHLIGEPRYLDAADRLSQFMTSALLEFPQAHVSAIDNLWNEQRPTEIIVLRGDEALMQQWQRDLQRVCAPHRMIFAIPENAVLPDGLAARQSPATGALAYVCRGTHCFASMDNWVALAETIRTL